MASPYGKQHSVGLVIVDPESNPLNFLMNERLSLGMLFRRNDYHDVVAIAAVNTTHYCNSSIYALIKIQHVDI